MLRRASAGVLLTMLAVAGCGAAEADPSATSGGAATAAPGAAGDARAPKPFACSRQSRVLGPPPAVPEAGRLARIVRRVDAFRGEGYEVRRAEVTHLGVVALISGNLAEARSQLPGLGVAHVYPWDPAAASTGVDGAGQVQQVLQWLLEPAVRDVRAASRGLPGSAGLALWQEAGAVLLSWKAPVPDQIAALEGRRPDGVRVIVDPVRFSARDVRAASSRAARAIRGGPVAVDGVLTYGCADGSGLVVGVEPPALRGRRAALQARLSEAAGMPVFVVPEPAPVPLMARQ